jgi:hypothetical protein
MRSRPGAPGRLDVYLMPSVIGGGLGDFAEVHSAGRWLSDAGFPVHIFRRSGHAWPRGLPGPFEWPRGVRRPRQAAPRALTVSSQFGITAAPERDEPLGRAGDWAGEVEALETAYGAERVLHVSLEEFARTLPSARQVDEREREGGVSARSRAAGRRSPARASAVRQAGALYRKYRAFDRANLVTLFPTFSPVPAFTSEFPEAVQVAPVRPHGVSSSGLRRRRGRTVLWYASPSTSGRLVEGVRAGLQAFGPGATLLIRAPPGFAVPPIPGVRIVSVGESDPTTWGRIWRTADVAIVSGSRSLLEAIGRRTRFLYFNGVLGRGRSARRHRPEKLDALLRMGERGGIGPALRRDLLDFSRARRVGPVLRDRLKAPASSGSIAWSDGFPRARADGTTYLIALARGFAATGAPPAPEYARRARAAAGARRTRKSTI